jgi:hypothetical protein
MVRDLSCALVNLIVFVVAVPTACTPKFRLLGVTVTGTNSYAPISTNAVGPSFPLMILGFPARSVFGK